jgi:hypothetical protein
MGFGGEDIACAGAVGAVDGGQGRRLFGVGGSEAAPSYSVEEVGADVHVEAELCEVCMREVDGEWENIYCFVRGKRYE